MATGNGRHRQRMIALLIASLLLLAWLVFGMVTDLRSRPVSYLVQRIPPANPYLCPGDSLRYEVELTVTQVPVVLEITEAWCRAGLGGVCARSLTTVYSVPVLEPRSVYALANRVMPESEFFRAGDVVEFWHATTDGKTTTGYIVGPVTVRDNCEAPEGSSQSGN